jgi:hypothetical protein
VAAPSVPGPDALSSEDVLFWRVQCEMAQVESCLASYRDILLDSRARQHTHTQTHTHTHTHTHQLLRHTQQAMDTADAVLPTAAGLCALIADFLGREGEQEDLEDRVQLQFVLTELLAIACVVDYGDEAGRRYVRARARVCVCVLLCRSTMSER